MKNGIHLFIVIMALTIASAVSAQPFGVKAGLNLSNLRIKDDKRNYDEGIDTKPGFHVGATAGFAVNELLSFETGLLFSTKGYKINTTTAQLVGTGQLTGSMNFNYFEIPLTAKARFAAGRIKICGALGPYIGMGLSGKYKYDHTYMGKTVSAEETIQWGSDKKNDFLKRFDYGLTAAAGVEIKSLCFGVSYGLGLANISTDTEGGHKMNNRVLGLSAGYKFGGK